MQLKTIFTVLLSAAAVATLATSTVMVPAPVTTDAIVGVPVDVVLPIEAPQALWAVINESLITNAAAVEAAVASEFVVTTPRLALHVCGVAPEAVQNDPSETTPPGWAA